MSKKRRPGMTNQGVRDLDDPGWRRRHMAALKPAEPYVLTEAVTQPTLIVDLIYCALEPADKEGVLALWPDAVFEQAYDFIHEYRTEVRVRCSTIEWYRFLVRSGLAEISLAFQFAMLDDQRLIKAVLDLERPGWRERTAARDGKEV
jgi:hypothetical protein